MINERLKKNVYDKKLVSSYFWRTYNGAEIEIVAEENGKLSAFEFESKQQNHGNSTILGTGLSQSYS